MFLLIINFGDNSFIFRFLSKLYRKKEIYLQLSDYGYKSEEITFSYST